MNLNWKQMETDRVVLMGFNDCVEIAELRKPYRGKSIFVLNSRFLGFCGEVLAADTMEEAKLEAQGVVKGAAEDQSNFFIELLGFFEGDKGRSDSQ